MDNLEKDKILASAYLLRQRELDVLPFEDPYSDMTPEEKSKLIIHLLSLREQDQRQMEAMREESKQQQHELMEQLRLLTAAISEQNEELKRLRKVEEHAKVLAHENICLREKQKVADKMTFGGKSQKGISKRKKSVASREKDKDDFDGTPGSITSDCASDEDINQTEATAAKEKEERLYRRGKEYRRMRADKNIVHRSDLSKLPAGAVVIKRYKKYSYDQISEIVEHQYEVVRYRGADGKIYDAYLPCNEETTIIDVVPGTHASSKFLAHLAFNRFVLDTPFYREIQRIFDEKMHLSRTTLSNWILKGSTHIMRVVEELKNISLEKDAIINCDETWCRVKVEGSYRKKYIWCLVNKSAKTVIYYYEKGSRSRDVLKHILGDSNVKALQSDGYNVYMYLDKQMIDVDHLCCMAHARAKFKYAYEQGGDEDAKFYLEEIGKLYQFEAEYANGKLSAEQVKICRRGLKTKEVIIRLRSKLDAQLSDNHPPRGELMEKALRYLNTFWKQLFAYLKDGNYSIDNSIAERFIRPLAGERKNSLFFGCDKMAVASAVYHTIISTCRMHKRSALEFLKRIFHAVVNGSCDYKQMALLLVGRQY